MLKDIEIRKTLMQAISKHNEGLDYRIIEEMAVCDGQARVDIAVANGRLWGYEIKSDADTLDRLENQIDCYNKTFDYVAIAVGEKYKSTISQYIPPWWGIYIIYQQKNGKARLKQARRSLLNRAIDPSALLELLWRNEIETFLKLKGIKGLSGKNRRILRRIVLDNFVTTEIRDLTRETLKHRVGWR